MKVVLYPYHLYLDNAEFHPDLSVKTGYVVNGAWVYESTKTECLAFRLGSSDGWVSNNSAGEPVNSWYRDQKEYYVIVPFNYTEEITDFRDYNQVMDWADKQQPSTEEELEVALVTDSEYKALKKQELDDLYDDIPF